MQRSKRRTLAHEAAKPAPMTPAQLEAKRAISRYLHEQQRETAPEVYRKPCVPNRRRARREALS